MLRSFVAVFLCLGLTSCQSYRPAPLAPGEILDSVARSRLEPDRKRTTEEAESEAILVPSGSPPDFTFQRATALMAQHGPALRVARAEFETALARAKVKTPLPNPSLDIGPQYGFGPDVGKLYRLQPFGSLGLTLPIGPRRKRQDELNRLNAERLWVETRARHRELYMDLRRLFASWAVSMARLEVRKDIEKSSHVSADLAKRLTTAGVATALDQGLIELEAARTRSELLSEEILLSEIEGEMSEMLGVHTNLFRTPTDSALPDLPASLPEEKELQDIMVFNHSELARLRAGYEVADGELRLEIARQWPDIQFGPSYERETGEKNTVLGLTLGIELPLFDRNQQEVATATKKREEARVKYEAAANRALAVLNRARRRLRAVGEKFRLVKDTLEPKAKTNVELARKSFEAGNTDALRFLETERALRRIQVETLEAEFEVRKGWVELEQAVGVPLVNFPGEDRKSLPDLDRIDRPTQ